FFSQMSVITHETGDLFEIAYRPEIADWAIAHCISEDCGMGKGIAVHFKKRYGKVADLKRQVANGKTKGSAAYLEADGRIIFYLITKEKYYNKPTYDTLEGSIKDMISIMKEKGVKGCVMPRIGCGLDRLDWVKVEKMLETHFHAAGKEAIVCTL
ncbi:hypothetical protein PFISCL1PPCAC_23703, partial [Pristionchus fissidentatus]